MTRILLRLEGTTQSNLLLVTRLIGGIPLLIVSSWHFRVPDSLRNVLIASEIPFADLTLVIVPPIELVAGFLLVVGFLARIAALVGMLTMLPAIYATVVIWGLDPANLPGGLSEVPYIPPALLPVMVLVCSGIVLWRGAGAFSLDRLRVRRVAIQHGT